MRYGYLGPDGTFSEAAVRKLPAAAGSALEPFPTVLATLDAVRSGACGAAVVPVENSVSGAVPSTLGELAGADGSLRIDGEVEVPVVFDLMARPGTELDDVGAVRSHPHAHSQCQRWLAERLPHSEVVPAESTAAAARDVAESGGRTEAAIAAPIAATRYGLAVLADDIGASHDAVTRFISVRRPGALPAPTGRDRSSFVVTTGSSGPGVLVDILTEFAEHAVDLSWIQSWPAGPALGRYHFFIDVEGHVQDDAVAAAVAAVREKTASVSVLGSYPRAEEPVPVSAGATG